MLRRVQATRTASVVPGSKGHGICRELLRAATGGPYTLVLVTFPIPNPAYPLAAVFEAVENAIRLIEQVDTMRGQHTELAHNYVCAIADAERSLRGRFIAGDLVWPGLNSERARQIAQHQLTTQTLVNLEREHQLDRMDQQAWFDLFPSARKSGHIKIVLAHIQLDELDKLSHQNQTKDLARTAIRLIDTLRALATSPEEPVEVGDRVTMQILADPPLHVRLESNDAEFMSRAQLVHAISGKPPTILTIDRGMIIRSHVHGVLYSRVS